MRINSRWWIDRYYCWVASWAEIIDGIIGVISLNYIHSSISFGVCIKHNKLKCKWAIKDYENKEENYVKERTR